MFAKGEPCSIRGCRSLARPDGGAVVIPGLLYRALRLGARLVSAFSHITTGRRRQRRNRLHVRITADDVTLLK